MAKENKKSQPTGYKKKTKGFDPEPITAELIERAHKLGMDLVWDS